MNKLLAALAALLIVQTAPAAERMLYQFPEGNARWTIDFTYTHAAGKDARIVKADVIRTGRYERSAYQWSDGSNTETWSDPKSNLHAVEAGPRRSVYVIPGEDSYQTATMVKVFNSDSFAWIRPNMLVGTETIDGVECLRYAGRAKAGVPSQTRNRPDPSIPEISCEAWIDATTNRPVALRQGDLRAVFTFSEEAPGDLAPPPHILQALSRFQAAANLPKVFPQN